MKVRGDLRKWQRQGKDGGILKYSETDLGGEVKEARSGKDQASKK